jgi:DNA-binding transcriptional LysR family regulator
MHKINWDDFRVVLAVCDAGSVNGAAKQLGLNHATILRRVANFEERHGVSIFIKSGKGYKLNQSSAQILNSLRSLDSAVVELERRLQGHESAISDVVRITSTDSFTDRILPELVVDLCKNQQGLLVNLMTTNNALDLDKTEADIAVRAGFEPPDGLISQEICRLGIAIYRRQT